MTNIALLRLFKECLKDEQDEEDESDDQDEPDEHEHEQDGSEEPLISPSNSSKSASSDFFREIIISYRLIFGQDKNSWKLYRESNGAHLNKRQHKACRDPLRPVLCGTEWSKVPMYEELGVPDMSTVYSAKSDFPFFAERLIKLQKHVAMQCANDWRALWRDRRDMGRFWALWAVVIFGGIAVLLGIIQLALGAAQVAGAYQHH